MRKGRREEESCLGAESLRSTHQEREECSFKDLNLGARTRCCQGWGGGSQREPLGGGSGVWGAKEFVDNMS